MQVDYVRDKYAQYYLLVTSYDLFPESGYALVDLDGSVYPDGKGVPSWTIVSGSRIPYSILLKLENRRKILEERGIESLVGLEAEAGGQLQDESKETP
jgi:hypothetical protein